MMKLLINLLISSLSVFISGYVLPGVYLKDFSTAIVVAVILGAVNMVVKPVLSFFALPLTILTLGLFQMVINASMVLLVSSLVPGFTVSGFFPALIFGFLLSIVSGFLHLLAK